MIPCLLNCSKITPLGGNSRRERVIDEAERRAGDEVPPIWIGLGHGRAEVAIGDGEDAGHATGERKVILGEVAHGLGGRAGHEALTGAAVVRLVGHLPVVAHAVGLALGRHVEGVDVVALPVGVRGRRLAVGSRVNPSPLPMSPRMLSKEWFSIITTTKCSIWGT